MLSRVSRVLVLVAALCAIIMSSSSIGHQVNGIAVMSVDLGTEFMKIAIVKPGVPMEIVLNKESRRKTPMAVSLRGGNEREFGEMALQQFIKKPKTAYVGFTQLLGKTLDSPVVRAYQKKYPYYDIKESSSGNATSGTTPTIVFQHDSTHTYTPEELLGMMLDYARELASDFGEQQIDSAVIAVPAYFTQAERKAVLAAAEMVDLRVLQLLNTNTAAALNYGVFRRKEFNNTGITHMFYDMGSAGTVVTIGSFHLYKYKEDYEANPQLIIRGVGFDRELGGAVFTERLAKHLARLFKEKTKKDAFTSPKAIAKLYKEAERVKNVLSANSEHFAQIEGLMDDVDFKAKVTRAEFEEMCSDLFDRVAKPIRDALATAEMSDPADLASVILVGGATRSPKVQEILMRLTGKTELGKNLNTDEAAAMGAVYQAAYESKGYKVKKFYIKDVNIYPIGVTFERFSLDADQNKEKTAEKKLVERVLFDRMNNFPQKKVMTFSRHNRDFDFTVNYMDLASYLDDRQQKILGTTTAISLVKVNEVKELFARHQNEDTKGIKCHFRLDFSGLLDLDKVEITFEKWHNRTEKADGAEGGLFGKITNFFGGEEKEQEETVKATTDDEKTATKTTATKTPVPIKSLNGSTNATVPAQNITYSRETIKFEQTRLDLSGFDAEQMKRASAKLADIKEKERAKKRKAAVVNDLESFIFGTKDKIEQAENLALLVDDARAELAKKLKETDDWMTEENHDNIELKVFEEKLAELRANGKDFYFRLDERKERPKQLEELKETLKKSKEFLESTKNSTGEDLALTMAEWGSLEKLIESTEGWQTYQLEAQAKLKESDTPKLLSKNIEEKVNALKREIQYMLTKIKYWRPKTTTTTPPPKPKSTTTTKSPKTNETETKKQNDEKKSEEESETTTLKPLSEEEKETTTEKSSTTNNPEL